MRLRQAPIENPGTIQIVESYHAPLKKEFKCISQDLGSEIGDAECLHIEVFRLIVPLARRAFPNLIGIWGAPASGAINSRTISDVPEYRYTTRDGNGKKNAGAKTD